MKNRLILIGAAVLQLTVGAPESQAGNVDSGVVLPSAGGTGTVSVLFPGAGTVTKEFTSNNSIIIEFTVVDDALPGFGFVNAISETVTNSTGVDWVGYHFEFLPLLDGDGLYFETQPPQPGPQAHSSSVFGTLLQPNEDTLDWSGGVVPDGGSVDFSFSFYVPDGISSFQLIQQAIPVPEPSSALLVGGGLLGLAARKRRR